VPVVGPILWARSAAPAAAARFVRAMGGTVLHLRPRRDPRGLRAVGDEQMVVSTSFGVPDARKVYVSLDLARATARSTTCGRAARSCRCIPPRTGAAARLGP
jgi:hypothetical protein